MAAGIDPNALTRTAYSFGAVHRGIIGILAFQPDGRITGPTDPALSRYTLEDGTLTILSDTGQPTATLAAAGGSLMSADGSGFVAHPILALEPGTTDRDLPAVFINTAPKAGTYLLAGALEQAGFENQHLHVMDDFLHDNRGVPMDEIHWDPPSRKVTCPVGVTASLLRPGQFVVGHLNSVAAMQAVEDAGVLLINVVRDPRHQIASMFAFKQAKVKPNPADQLWQSMRGLEAFKAFLISQPIRLWVRQTTRMLKRRHVLTFEDLKAGELGRANLDPALTQKITTGLTQALGTKTSTYLPRDGDETATYLADPAVIAYFKEVGVQRLARTHWPDNG